MPTIPDTYSKNPQSQQMSMAPNLPNITTGNGTLDQIISLLLNGTGVAPRPYAGQSIYESYIQRQRSNEFLGVMRSGLENMPIVQKLGGLDAGSEFTRALLPYIAGPGGIADNPMVRAMNGGNPIAAQMSILSRGTGLTAANMTGQFKNLSVGETSSMMEGVNDAIFNKRTVTEADISKSKQNIEEKIQRLITKTIETEQSRIPQPGEPASQVNEAITALKAQDQTLANDKKLGVFDSTGKFDIKKFQELQDSPGGLTSQNIKLKEAGEDTIKALKDVAKSIKDKTQSVVTPLQQAKSEVDRTLGQMKSEGINSQITRGFESQDLTKTTMMGIDLGMVDYKKDYRANLDKIKKRYRDQGVSEEDLRTRQAEFEGEALKETMKTSVTNIAPVMRAGADLFGTETSADTLAAVNQLFGNSRINFNNEKEKDAAVNLLREVKSVARATGISSEEILKANNTTRAYAAANTDQALTGGQSQIKSTLKTMQEANVMAEMLGSGYIRERGGITNFVQEEIASKALVKKQPINRKLMGMMAYVNSIPGLDNETRRKLTDEIINTANDTSKPLTGATLSGLQQRLAEMSGNKFNQVQIEQAGRNEMMVQQGFKLNERRIGNNESSLNEDATVAGNFYASLKIMADDKIRGGGPIEVQDIAIGDITDNEGNIVTRKGEQYTRKIKTANEALEYYKSLYQDGKGQKLGIEDPRMYAAAGLGLSSQQLDQFYGPGGGPEANANWAAVQRDMLRNSPEGQKKLAAMSKKVQEDIKLEEDMSKNLSYLQQPLGQSIMQLLVNGQFAEGVAPIQRILQNTESSVAVQNTANAVDRMNQAKTMKNMDAAFFAATGGGDKTTSPAATVKQLKELNYSDKQIAAVLKQRAAYAEGAGKSELERIMTRGNLTLDQLNNFADMTEQDYEKAGGKSKFGVDHDDIVKARKFGTATGLFNERTNKMFGKLALDEKSMSRIYQAKAGEEVINITKNNAIAKEVRDVTQRALEEELQKLPNDRSDTDLKKTIIDNLGTAGQIDAVKVAKAFSQKGSLDKGTVKNLDELQLLDASGELKTQEYLDTLNYGVGEGADQLRKEAIAQGRITGQEGEYTMTGEKAAKFAEQIHGFKGLEAMKTAGIGIDESNSVTKQITKLSEIVAKIEEVTDQAKINTGAGGKEGQGPLIDLIGGLETGMGNISATLNTIAVHLGVLTKFE